MISRRAVLAGGMTGMASWAGGVRAATPNMSVAELKIGNIMPYSGRDSSYGTIGTLEAAFFKKINAEGGIAGRTIKFISLDDASGTTRAAEEAHRLIEKDGVDFLFSTLGTSTNETIERYANEKKVPHLFLASGADRWGDFKSHPWTIGLQPSYRIEAQIYTQHALQKNPQAKIAVLYRNDDFGKDYLLGLRDVVGPNWNDRVAKVASYEATEPTVYSQLTALKGSGADVLICAAAPQQAIQTIRTVPAMGWHPLFFMTNMSISAATVMRAAGAREGNGIITGAWLKDNADRTWREDAAMNEWHSFMAKWLPDADLNDNSYVYAYTACKVMLHVLINCNGDLSRENVMMQATNIHRLEVPTLLPGITVSTSPTNYHPVRALQLQQWSGNGWARFGEIIEGVER